MDIIVCTNYEKVDKDDFYLSKDWEEEAGKENLKRARKLQKKGNLFIAYKVPAKSLCLYQQMDANQIFINFSGETIIQCETVVIGNEFTDKWEYEG